MMEHVCNGRADCMVIDSLTIELKETFLNEISDLNGKDKLMEMLGKCRATTKKTDEGKTKNNHVTLVGPPCVIRKIKSQVVNLKMELLANDRNKGLKKVSTQDANFDLSSSNIENGDKNVGDNIGDKNDGDGKNDNNGDKRDYVTSNKKNDVNKISSSVGNGKDSYNSGSNVDNVNGNVNNDKDDENSVHPPNSLANTTTNSINVNDSRLQFNAFKTPSSTPSTITQIHHPVLGTKKDTSLKFGQNTSPETMQQTAAESANLHNSQLINSNFDENCFMEPEKNVQLLQAKSYTGTMSFKFEKSYSENEFNIISNLLLVKYHFITKVDQIIGKSSKELELSYDRESILYECKNIASQSKTPSNLWNIKKKGKKSETKLTNEQKKDEIEEKMISDYLKNKIVKHIKLNQMSVKLKMIEPCKELVDLICETNKYKDVYLGYDDQKLELFIYSLNDNVKCEKTANWINSLIKENSKIGKIGHKNCLAINFSLNLKSKR